MLQNAIIIAVVMLVLLRQYLVDYGKGVRSAVFVLLVAPMNLSLEFENALPSLTIHRFLIVLMAAAWLQSGNVPRKTASLPFGGLVLTVAAVMGISVLISDNLLISMKRYCYFLFESVLFFFIIANSIRDKAAMLSLMKTIVLALTAVALLGIVERYTKLNPTEFFGAKHATEFERVTGVDANDVTATYLHRILFGTAMAAGALYALFLIDYSGSRKEKIRFTLAALMTTTALYFGMSRGPWLAFCGASAVLLFFSGQALRRRYLLLGALMLLVFLVRPGTLDTLASSYSSTFRSDTVKGASYEWRYIVLDMAFTKITHADSLANMLFGFGQGSHLFLTFPRIELATGQPTEFYSWDNEFAVILLEHGFAGIALVGVLYLAFLRRTADYCLKQKTDWELMVLPMTAVIAFMLMKTNVKFYTPQLEFIEFANIAFASVLLSGFPKASPEAPARPWMKFVLQENTKSIS